MAYSLNKVILIGNLGKDAETRFTTSNISVTNFSLATTHSYKGKDGNWVNDTTWHNIVAFSVSDSVKSSLLKGNKVCVEGRIQNRNYTDKEGIKRYVTEIVSERIVLLDSRPTGQEDTSATVEDPEMQDDSPLPF